MQDQQMQVHSEVPAAIYQQAGTYGLGTLMAVYMPRLPSVRAVIGTVVGVIVGSIIFFGTIAVLTHDVAHLEVFGILFTVMAIFSGIGALSHCNLRVYLFSNGLIRAKGNQADPIRWDQVTSVVQKEIEHDGSDGVPTYGISQSFIVHGSVGATKNGVPVDAPALFSQSFIVHRSDGATFEFNDVLKNVAQLGQSIQLAVTQQHMPWAMAAYNGGGSIPFGPLTVSMQGLSNGRKVLPWNEVKSVDVVSRVEGSERKVIVRRVGKRFNWIWAKITISQIPNLLVFMRLVNYARTGGAY